MKGEHPIGTVKVRVTSETQTAGGHISLVVSHEIHSAVRSICQSLGIVNKFLFSFGEIIRQTIKLFLT